MFLKKALFFVLCMFKKVSTNSYIVNSNKSFVIFLFLCSINSVGITVPFIYTLYHKLLNISMFMFSKAVWGVTNILVHPAINFYIW